jgi:hypothetical protein
LRYKFRQWLAGEPVHRASGALSFQKPRTKSRKMKTIHIYQSAAGWIYEIWFDGRPLVVGCSKTREKAEFEAAIA